MKAIGRVAPYALLFLPLLLWSAFIWLVNAPVPESNPEGAAFGRFFLDLGATLVLPPMVAAIAAWALRKRRIAFPLFFALVLLALGPIAYFLCVIFESSIPVVLAVFCAVVAFLSYRLYRVAR